MCIPSDTVRTWVCVSVCFAYSCTRGSSREWPPRARGSIDGLDDTVDVSSQPKPGSRASSKPLATAVVTTAAVTVASY